MVLTFFWAHLQTGKTSSVAPEAHEIKYNHNHGDLVVSLTLTSHENLGRYFDMDQNPSNGPPTMTGFSPSPGSTSQIPTTPQTTSLNTADVLNAAQSAPENSYTLSAQLNTTQVLPSMPRIPHHTTGQQEPGQNYAISQQTVAPHPTPSRSLPQYFAPANATLQQSVEHHHAKMITILEEQLRQVQSDYENKSDKVSELQAKNAYLANVIDAQNTSEGHLVALMDQLQVQNRALQDEIDKGCTSELELRQEHDAAIREIGRYSEQLRMQTRGVMIREIEVQRLRNHLTRARGEAAMDEELLEGNNQKIRDLQFKVEEMTRENETSVASGKFLLALNRKLRKEKKILRDDNDVLNENLRSRIKDADAEDDEAMTEQINKEQQQKTPDLQVGVSDVGYNDLTKEKAFLKLT
ncbi:hypothetical protein VTL71DRAFT_11396 [Oculimacula yallundae]|uniref:Uncharacterized protein n=1 Tax=Oculimacula yallundae TaxID=86028 RepID=A0ABR4CRQ9_9HELO